MHGIKKFFVILYYILSFAFLLLQLVYIEDSSSVDVVVALIINLFFIILTILLLPLNHLWKRQQNRFAQNNNLYPIKEANPALLAWNTKRKKYPCWHIIYSIIILFISLIAQKYFAGIVIIQYLLIQIVCYFFDDNLRDRLFTKKLYNYLHTAMKHDKENNNLWKEIIHAILIKDDTGRIPVTFGNSINRPSDIMIFDNATEILTQPQDVTDEKWQDIYVHAAFFAYVLETGRYSLKELELECEKAVGYMHYQISKPIYMYFVGESDNLNHIIEKYGWMPELHIKIVPDYKQINLQEVIDDYFSRFWIIHHSYDIQNAFSEIKQKSKSSNAISENGNNARVVTKNVNSTNVISKNSNSAHVINENDTYNLYERLIKIESDMDNTTIHRITTYNKDNILFRSVIEKFTKSRLSFTCFNPRYFLRLYCNTPVEELALTDKNVYFRNYNKFSSRIYFFIPRIESLYHFYPKNFYLCGFFQNIFRSSERIASILAGFDYADLVLRFVVYYLAIRRGKGFSEEYVCSDLQTMGDKIAKLVTKDVSIYTTIFNEGIEINATVHNALTILAEFFPFEYEGDTITFQGLVFLLRAIRNNTRGHGSIKEEIAEPLWFALYVLLVVLGDFLRIYDFQIEIQDDEIYIGYQSDDNLYPMGDYGYVSSMIPCVIFQIEKNEREYINYFKGNIIVPNIIKEEIEM